MESSKVSSDEDVDWLKREDFILIDITTTAEITIEIIKKAPMIQAAHKNIPFNPIEFSLK